MNKSTKLGLLFASALFAASGAATAQTKDIPGDTKNSGYALSPNGNVVQSATGLCWRTGYFAAPMALRDCDAALMPPPPPPPATTATSATTASPSADQRKGHVRR